MSLNVYTRYMELSDSYCRLCDKYCEQADSQAELLNKWALSILPPEIASLNNIQAKELASRIPSLPVPETASVEK